MCFRPNNVLLIGNNSYIKTTTYHETGFIEVLRPFEIATKIEEGEKYLTKNILTPN